ncbi:DUF3043 domain-containing protein [uncultured Georgenia sp.]|uniref:DUF3043 domain-containing protein n=1 Tax=uncultured Georgenia sp. TaxID=378209 RepID=UPI00260755ED|nr:DUF3043 domain-containing protein [uncultured Georgenia sp.]HLV05158.1 DUF3043 domain-containing protein [Actinomycetaceae bacterium]
MIGRSKKETPAPAPEPEAKPKPQGKGRPTPKRREVEAQRKRPLVPADRKAARQEARRRRNELYAKQQEAMRTGDERYLPPRDKGPVRRWVRNYVDAHFSPSEYFLPLAMASIVLLFFASMIPDVAIIGMIVMYVAFAISLAFAIGFTIAVKRKLKARFDEEQIPRFTGMYAFSRLFQPRFLRAPKPQVKRGETIA